MMRLHTTPFPVAAIKEKQNCVRELPSVDRDEHFTHQELLDIYYQGIRASHARRLRHRIDSLMRLGVQSIEQKANKSDENDEGDSPSIHQLILLLTATVLIVSHRCCSPLATLEQHRPRMTYKLYVSSPSVGTVPVQSESCSYVNINGAISSDKCLTTMTVVRMFSGHHLTRKLTAAAGQRATSGSART
jgi:hypothetical protein